MSQADYFLKIDGINGESKDHKHKGEIEVLSFTLGANQQTTRAPGWLAVGKAEVHDATFVVHMCKASPKLSLACASGERFKNAVLTGRKAGGKQEEFYIVRFTDVLVSSFVTGGSQYDSPTEQFSLDFDRLEEEYREQQANGTLGPMVKAGWDVRQNRAV